jgi:MoaA/NifB/PqqE/SkfB family radical SAM enzyme
MGEIVMKVKMVQVGITTRCNSQCHFCFREELKRAGRKEGPVDMPVEVFKKILSNKDVCDIQLCCNRGESIFHPQIDTIIDMIKGSDCRFEMNTNGDRFDPDWWYNLGKKMTGGDQIVFALDGLKEAHEYYRGTKWMRVINNMKAFINGGGRSIWQLIAFEHNQKQIEIIEALSRRIGCAETWIINSRKYNDRYRRPTQKFNKTKEDILRDEEPNSIKCRFLYGERVYIGVDGQVWPCCFTRCHFGFKEKIYPENPVTDAVKEESDYINVANTPLNEIAEKSNLFKTVFFHMNNRSVPYIEAHGWEPSLDEEVMFNNPNKDGLMRHPRLMVNFACQLYCGDNPKIDNKNRRRVEN